MFGSTRKQPECTCKSQDDLDPNCPLGEAVGYHPVPPRDAPKPLRVSLGGRGRQVTESLKARTLDWLSETVQIEMPKRPVDQWGKPLNPRLPWDITKLSIEEIGMLYGQFVAMYDYGSAQLGLIDVDYTEAEVFTDLEEAKAGLRAGGDNAQDRKNNAKIDAQLVSQEMAKMERKAKRAMLSRVVAGYEHAFKCLSREMTRRGIGTEGYR